MILYSNVSFYGENTSSPSLILGSSGQIQIISNTSSNINFIMENIIVVPGLSEIVIFPFLLINNISFAQIKVI